MKTINLLKEGHGIRYSPTPPAREKKESFDIDRTALQARNSGFGKPAMIIGGIVLLLVGLYLAYNSFGPLGPKLASLRGSIIPSKGAQKPEAAKPAEPPAQTAKAAPSPAATKPPVKPGVTASQLGTWYQTDKAYPYAIVVASFKKEDSAVTYTRRLQDAGHPTTLAPTDLGAKGLWYRVVLGRYETNSKAREAASKLKGTKPFGDSWTTRLPYAVEVGSESDKAAAESAQKALAAKGVTAFMFPEASASDKPVTFKLIAGGFSSGDQAKAFAEKLQKAGIETQVVTP